MTLVANYYLKNGKRFSRKFSFEPIILKDTETWIRFVTAILCKPKKQDLIKITAKINSDKIKNHVEENGIINLEGFENQITYEITNK